MQGNQSQMPPKPTKPTIEYTPTGDGGFCLDRINASKLGTYIMQLEDGYDGGEGNY